MSQYMEASEAIEMIIEGCVTRAAISLSRFKVSYTKKQIQVYKFFEYILV